MNEPKPELAKALKDVERYRKALDVSQNALYVLKEDVALNPKHTAIARKAFNRSEKAYK